MTHAPAQWQIISPDGIVWSIPDEDVTIVEADVADHDDPQAERAMLTLHASLGKAG